MSARRRRGLLLVTLACSSLGAAGCAARPHRAQGPPGFDVRLDVPLQSQEDPRQCGVAALAMVARYYGRELSASRRAALAGSAERQGALGGADLAEALRADGYYVAIFRGGLDESVTGLRHHLARGRPLIVMLRHEGHEGAGHHYVVLTGHDGASGAWLVADPRHGRRSIDPGAFLASWAGAGHFTLLAVPGSADPPTTKGSNDHEPAKD